jgi:hypothetical protein
MSVFLFSADPDYYFRRSQRVDCALHQTTHWQDTHKETSQLSHPGPGQTQTTGNTSKTQGSEVSPRRGEKSEKLFLDFLIFTLLQTFSAVSKANNFSKLYFALLLAKIVTRPFLLSLEATAQHKFSSIYLDTLLKKLFI